MKFTQSLYWLLALISTVQALALPAYFSSVIDTSRELYKRKGGGGGGGKGGGGGSSSSGSSSSGSSSSGSSSGGTTSGGTSGGTTSGGSRGGGSTTGGTTSGTSNTGGRTISGSGPAASYGRGGGYYGGGASVPYRAGTSRGGFVPPLLIGSALIFPALWLYGAYAYPYDRPWTYRNETSGQNETHPVECLCAQYASCGCEQNNTDSTFQQQVANNKTIAQLANVNGTETLVINGTLPNGTTAAGGTDDGSGTTTTTGAASGLKLALIQGSGWWVVVAGVSYTMWFM